MTGKKGRDRNSEHKRRSESKQRNRERNIIMEMEMGDREELEERDCGKHNDRLKKERVKDGWRNRKREER